MKPATQLRRRLHASARQQLSAAAAPLRHATRTPSHTLPTRHAAVAAAASSHGRQRADSASNNRKQYTTLAQPYTTSAVHPEDHSSHHSLYNHTHDYYQDNYELIEYNSSNSTPQQLGAVIPLMYDMSQVRERSMNGITVTIAQRKHQLYDIESDGRTPMDSYIRLHYHFSSNKELRARYSLFNRDEIRIGRIIEDLDALAGDISYRHISQPVIASSNGGNKHHNTYHSAAEKCTVVTASLDRVDLFRSQNLARQSTISSESMAHIDDKTLNHDWIVSGRITYAGNSSLEVRIDIGRLPPNSTDADSELESLGCALFVMVARDKSTYKAYQVPPLHLVTPIDQQLFDSGLENKKRRKTRIERPYYKQSPSVSESAYLHELYLSQLHPNNARTVTTPASHLHLPSQPYKHQPTVPMSHCKQRKVSLMHSQDRNIHNKMFGGHLMRLAFELGYACAYGVTHIKPRLQSIDDIHFLLPVEIGSILHFTSQVYHTDPQKGSVLVYVQAQVVDTNTGVASKTTNEFFFQFVCRQSPSEQSRSTTAAADSSNVQPATPTQSIPYVIPYTYDECVKHLEGRRRSRELMRPI